MRQRSLLKASNAKFMSNLIMVKLR